MKTSLKEKFYFYKSKIKEFTKTPRGEKMLKIGSRILQLLIIGIIIYQLSFIGWGNVLTSLPTHPVFYMLFLVIYFLLPLSETIAYKICWNIPYLKSIPIFIKKRIFNKDVMGYSGELVLMQWAVKHLSIAKKQAFKDIRDMNIISSAASTFAAFSVLLMLISTGQIKALDYIFNKDFFENTSLFEYTAAAFIVALVIALVFRFRKYLYSMSFDISLQIFGIHTARMLLIYAIQILQWHIVLPGITMEIWFTFLSVNILMSRIPFIPSHELVATGTNIELAKILKVPVAPISGLFLIHDVLSKTLNLLFYSYYSLKKKRSEAIV